MPKKKEQGQPRAFRSARHLVEWFDKYCEELEDGGFRSAPTLTGFARWCRDVKGSKVSRRTLYSAIHEYYPEIRDELEDLRADTLVNGAAQGKYAASVTIFALKNWCRWSDRVESNESGKVEIVLPDEADEEAY